ncbi:MAG: AsmA family protein, partial [Gallionella sp.]|nr:AsmA family protein [Gallionella sp.]
NDNLAVKAPVLRIAGNGDIDIGNDSLNYSTKTTVSKAEGGGSVTVPVSLSGPFTALKFKVDYGAVVADVAKQKAAAKVEATKSDLKAKAQEQLKNKLKGLFK